MASKAQHGPENLFAQLRAPTGTIELAFRCMEIAEEEIAAAKCRSPLLSFQLEATFRGLCPTEPLRGLDEAVYRHHCRELLDRVVAGEDLLQGTAGECLGLLSRASLDAPPTRAAELLYWKLFEQVLPHPAKSIRDEAGLLTADAYDEACMRELEADIRRRLRSTRRGH